MRLTQNLKVCSSIFLAVILCSCVPKNKSSSRLKVIASVPVIYDWTRNLMDEPTNTKLFLNLITKNGLNYHSCVPGVTEENLINSANLLIYVGGPSEKWIDDIVSKTASQYPERLVLKLIDFVKEPDGSLPDEHFIISPELAQICCSKISEYLSMLDPDNNASYNQYCTKYLELLNILDDSYKLQAQKTQNQTFIICDRMPFKYLFDEYGFNFISIYDNCPAPEEKPDLNKIQDFGSAIDNFEAGAVYVFEDSDKKLAKQVIGNSKNPRCDTNVLDSMESLTLSQLFSGKNYINIMQNNLTLLHAN